jgi:hypothetical protein|tara:strand:+ start:507 stop:809 length:303 start_codon:yes stop_codon:yes gene_type:complete
MRSFLSIVVILGIVLWADGAFSGSAGSCTKYRQMEQKLLEIHEYRIGHGTNMNGTVSMEFWAAEDGSTWTLIRVDSNNVACLVAFGRDWVIQDMQVGDPT